MAATPALWSYGDPIHFIKPTRPVHSTWIHCSASDQAAHDDVAVMRRWHLERGWNDVGYHFFIRKSGDVQAGRNLEQIPAAQAGHNTGAIAVCLHGLEVQLFTEAQLNTLRALAQAINVAYDLEMRFRGHREVSVKTCPVFNYQLALGLDEEGRLPTQSDGPPLSSVTCAHIDQGPIEITARGPAVSILQNLLNFNGIFCIVDGIFGQQTLTSLHIFQRNAGLSTTWHVDNTMRRRLAEGLEGVRVLALGDFGNDVRAFQNIMQQHGIPLVADGDYGPNTRSAVRSFHRMHGSPSQDNVDANTRQLCWQ